MVLRYIYLTTNPKAPVVVYDWGWGVGGGGECYKTGVGVAGQV